MEQARSADGTVIAFDRLGDGPPLVLVSGASCDHQVHTALAAGLAEHFTVVNYDRRGRGESGDTPPYAVEREIDDIAAVIDAAGGGPAHLFGASSGATLTLHAAAAGLPVTRLALWEPPFALDDEAARAWLELRATLEGLIAAGRNGDAVETFMLNVGVPPQLVAGMKGSPAWPGLERIAPTLAYDGAVQGDGRPPHHLFPKITMPVLVLEGEESPEDMRRSAQALLAALPGARHAVLKGQGHQFAPELMVPALVEFFSRPV
ncbi:alpha/beta fold hydrolase [Actinomadura macrotermitis]|uniref:AB hydrolase-1 domain-containing protein n=1 Tax=Actinomadura macrotermitis TaxID=2585200 RepID=A0A7K0C779_9ACTN|nr:alpha/beta hydrolase [Actinomadura macrotermitis]MQY08962.1 hypothetical protein [Actinomadura macrotermitis]